MIVSSLIGVVGLDPDADQLPARIAGIVGRVGIDIPQSPRLRGGSGGTAVDVEEEGWVGGGMVDEVKEDGYVFVEVEVLEGWVGGCDEEEETEYADTDDA